MSKFNHSSQGSRQTYTKEGGTAYKMYDKDKLVTMVLTSFFNEPKFYGDNSEELVTIAKQIMDRDPKFVASLAVYAREVFYMRSVTHVLAVELANHPEGRKYARQTVSRIAQRPDDVTEIMAYQLGVYGRKNPIPNSLKKGLADAFSTFDEYQLAKYNRTGKDVTLKDVFRLVSPSAKKGTERYELYKRLLENTLQVPYTWETQLSQKGNKKEVWEELIDSGKVGYMALLRNLRNIVNSGASNIDTVYNILRDPERVKKSKQLPFRFFSAYRVV
ncbi:TROVE domain-containing protein [Bacillus pseudomycoides]|nr:TROVE domain-containing protein [Bacillus pseudomycoides]